MTVCDGMKIKADMKEMIRKIFFDVGLSTVEMKHHFAE